MTKSNVNYKGIDASTVSINDYRLLNPKLAEVVATVTGRMSPAAFFDKMQASLKHEASPIQGSFRWMTAGKVATGFVALTKAIQPLQIEAQLA